MSSIDDRVVKMTFDNSQFGAGVTSTLGMLSRLKQSLSFNEGMHSFGTQIEGINAKLLAMGTVGVTALATITNKAVNAGLNLAKSLTLSPITAGLQEYGTNLNSIQTILANTQASGANLQDVNKALDELNDYSDKTIYNFSEMARNIGTFTAAGVDLKTATGSIKGIANLAALSGSNSQQASTAMYQLSQAISAGRVSLQDWNSVVNAGMGGTVFQRALAQTAENMGTLEKGAVKLSGKMKNATINGQSFRESISAKPGEKSWLTSEVLTKTLEQFTGDLTDAELKAQGFNAEQIKAIQAQAKTAQDAATQVKTLGQVFDVAKETMGSGWSQTFRLIFGDFEEAKKTFTDLSNAINGVINRFSDARNQILGDWKKIGGRNVAIVGIKQGFQALGDVIGAVKLAFRDLFPAKTGKDLYDLTKKFQMFMKSLIPSEHTLDNIQSIFRGIFAVFDIGIQIVKGIAHVFGQLFNTVRGGAGGGIMDLAANIGEMVYSFDQALKSGGLLTKFFDTLGKVLSAPVKLFGAVASALAAIFTPSTTKGIQDAGGAVGDFANKLSPFGGLLERLNEGWKVFIRATGRVGALIAKIGPAIGHALGGIGDAIAANFTGNNFDRALDTINTGLLAGIALLIKRFFDNGIKVDVGQLGFFDKVGGMFDALTEKTQAMTQQVKAKTLLIIAGAIGILTASVVVLASIDSDALTRALTAMAAGFGQLLVSMAILTKMAGVSGFLKLPALAASLVLVAGAMLVLATAMKIFATMSWDELLKGLAGVAGSLAILSASVIPLSKAQGPMLRSAVAIGILGGALILLATAMKIFATMDWREMGKGLTGVVGSLTAIAVAMRLMPKGMVAQAAGLVLIAGALNGIGLAMKLFATMNWEEMGKGLTAVVGSLTAIAIAMQLMPKGMLLQAAALIAVATALNILGGALKIMATMSWEEIGKGLATIGGALVILAGGLYLMQGAVAGAAALLIAAGAIALLTPSLVVLGNLSMETIAKALGTLAASFVVLGVAALVLTPVIGVLAALAGVVALIGAGIALAGAGILAFSAAITALVAVGTAGITILTAMLTAIISLIPDMVQAFAEGLLQLVDTIGNGAPRIVAAFVKITASLLKAVIVLAPKIASAVLAIIRAILKILVEAVPEIADAGLKMMIGFLGALRDNIPEIARVVTEIIVAFIQALGENVPDIIDAGIQAMVDFINGTADALRNHSGDIGGAITNLIDAMAQVGRDCVTGLVNGLLDATGLSSLGHAVGSLANTMTFGLAGHLGIGSPSKVWKELGQFTVQGFAIGLRDTSDIQSAMDNMKQLLTDSLNDARQEITDQKEKIKSLNESIIDDQAKLAKLLSAKKPDADAIRRARRDLKEDQAALAEAKAALASARDIRNKSLAGSKAFNKGLADEQKKLLALSVQYKDISDRLDDARDALKDATAERDNFNKSITEKFTASVTIDDKTTVEDYTKSLSDLVDKNVEFKKSLDQLRAAGLDDTAYRKFLEEGTVDQGFLDQLIAAGPDAIRKINDLNAAMAISAKALGDEASKQLYQAGVDAAAGIVKGLESQQLVIGGMMDKIATQMVTTIKKQLGIKSPSKVFEEIAKFSMDGLTGGFKKYGESARFAAADVAELATQALKESLSTLATVIPEQMEMNPTIAPVLDLSSVQKTAATLSTILAPRDVSVNVSYDQASVLALETAASKKAQDEFMEMALVQGDTLQFIQNNNSPKALSSAEIYRQTKNQLSVVKGALPS